jgi:hypothetical protein
MPKEIVLRAHPAASFAAAGIGVTQLPSLPPARIGLPALPTGHVFFDLWPVRETPDQGAWAETSFQTVAPPLFVLNDALVHSSAGILAAGGLVMAETLDDTEPGAQAYRRLSRGIGITPRRATRLNGTHVSVLTPRAEHYEASLLRGLARLSALPDGLLLEAESLLIPAGGCMQGAMLRLLDLLPSVAMREVAADETLLIERLVVPLTVGGDMDCHPCLLGFFGRLSGAVPPATSPLPRRVFLAQHPGARHAIANEAELAAALQPLGFRTVQTGNMPLAAQIQLFRQAEAIVAPQGGALANLGFCRPGTAVVELMSADDVNWRFRHLAALAGLRYDCVLALTNAVSPAHTAAAAAQAMHPQRLAA